VGDFSHFHPKKRRGNKVEVKNKGQVAGGVAENLLVLLVIVAIAFVTIRVASNMESSFSSGDVASSTAASAAHGNFSGGLWDAYQLMSLAPYLIGALVVIALVVGFARIVGVGRM
jgi:hypothetical protein